MLLAIDVGNTNMVFAVHDGERVVAEWRCRTERQRTADEYFVWLQQLMEHNGLPQDVESVVISSVVPQVLFNLRVLADRYFHTRAKVVGRPDVRLPVAPRVDPSTQVGADRLVNTVGAYDRYGGDLIVDRHTACCVGVGFCDLAEPHPMREPGLEPRIPQCLGHFVSAARCRRAAAWRYLDAGSFSIVYRGMQCLHRRPLQRYRRSADRFGLRVEL